MYADRVPPEEPPCEGCRVDPLEENKDPLEIFFLTQYQLIMGPKGPIDINQLAVHAAIDLYGARNPRECFSKAMKLSKWWIDRMGDGHDN